MVTGGHASHTPPVQLSFREGWASAPGIQPQLFGLKNLITGPAAGNNDNRTWRCSVTAQPFVPHKRWRGNTTWEHHAPHGCSGSFFFSGERVADFRLHHGHVGAPAVPAGTARGSARYKRLSQTNICQQSGGTEQILPVSCSRRWDRLGLWGAGSQDPRVTHVRDLLTQRASSEPFLGQSSLHLLVWGRQKLQPAHPQPSC